MRYVLWKFEKTSGRDFEIMRCDLKAQLKALNDDWAMAGQNRVILQHNLCLLGANKNYVGHSSLQKHMTEADVCDLVVAWYTSDWETLTERGRQIGRAMHVGVPTFRTASYLSNIIINVRYNESNREQKLDDIISRHHIKLYEIAAHSSNPSVAKQILDDKIHTELQTDGAN